ncbi:MAG TPA: NB-ARC domain-containing protein, partial [Ktedonobacteraceae bacterium]|nr:NB-ARC domain-containing protein [Ktedonobacteraceae bacterium]
MKPNQLKMERALRGWSQARVAEAVGTNVRTVIRWEQGQTLPHPYYQEQLCALFGKNARELGLLVENDPPVEPAIDEPVVQRQDPHSTPLAIETPLFDPAIPAALVNAGGLIGRERLLTDLKQQLWEGGNRTLIALQGLPGMGKTALAVALTHDHLLRERFRDGILWAGLGQEADVLSQLARWGKLLGIAPGDVGNAESRDAWGKALRAVIGSRRMLLIIDDAWSVEDALALQVGGAHCAHVLTTRLPTVAFAFAKEGTQIVPELKTDDGLALLTQFVPHL